MKTKQNIYKAKRGVLEEYKRDLKSNASLYIMVIPVLLFYIIFCYKPMYGVLMAFQQYSPRTGIWGSPWIGLQNFKDFLTSPDFGRIFKNTLTISLTSLIVNFPAPIILALLLNEIRQKCFKSVSQTIMYIPHFISMVVICGMIKDFVSDKGIVSQLIAVFTGEQVNLLNNANLYLPIYILSDTWQGIGWGSVIYMAALSGVDREMYEAASVDGCGKWKQTIHITIPAIVPTIVIMFILRIGNLLSIGYEKTILLYNPLIYEKADIISSYVYRQGFEGQNWSYSTAVGVFNSVINLMLVTFANYISRKLNDTSLW